MSTATRVAVLLAGLCVAASAARAQYPQRRDGFWIGFGLGYGTATVSCDNCNFGPRTGGVSAFLKLGGAPSRNLLIGGAINGWAHSDGSATETVTNATASIYLYPRRHGGFFVTRGARGPQQSPPPPPPLGRTPGGVPPAPRPPLPVGAAPSPS